jgi:hypothetical protein
MLGSDDFRAPRLASLGLAWLGLAWLGLAWLGLQILDFSAHRN